MWINILFLALGGYLLGVGTERIRFAHRPRFVDYVMMSFGILSIVLNGALIAHKLGLV